MELENLLCNFYKHHKPKHSFSPLHPKFTSYVGTQINGLPREQTSDLQNIGNAPLGTKIHKQA